MRMETKMTTTEVKILEKYLRKRHSKAGLRKRFEVIYLYFYKRLSRSEIVRKIGTNGPFIDRWTARWLDSQVEREQWLEDNAELAGDERLHLAFLLGIVSDKPRSGKPPIYDQSVRDKVIALAKSCPGDLGLPFTHWTHELLAQQVVSRGISPTMSSTRVGDFLKSARLEATP